MKASPLSDICPTHSSVKWTLGEIRENGLRKPGVSLVVCHKLHIFRNMLTYVSTNGHVRI